MPLPWRTEHGRAPPALGECLGRVQHQVRCEPDDQTDKAKNEVG